MPVRVNLRLIERKSAHLTGDLPPEEFAADYQDEIIRFAAPLHYDLEVSPQGEELLVQGKLSTTLECDCSRCLKTFQLPLELPEFAALAPLQGEEALPVDGDFADLTPLLREDTFLALPTNPLCRPECRGLAARDSRLETPRPSEAKPSPWDALNKLKL